MRRPFDPALSARLDWAVTRMEATRGWRVEHKNMTMQLAQYWQQIHHADPRALEMADRHYSRQAPGTPEFTPSGNKIVLMHFLDDSTTPAALWATHRPAPGKAVRADGLDAWACTMFRVEHRTVLASELIKEAVAVVKGLWEPLPVDGFYTTVNTKHVEPTRVRGRDVWGYCYIKAGWEMQAHRTKARDLVILMLDYDKLASVEPLTAVMNMPPFGTAWRRWPRTVADEQMVLL